ncbi:MAG: Ni/Fe-hydrogenase 1 b-type cytochrome subunit [Gammaproteobacteria bacterium BRH_c0]|nr:MAG: Ni/Fe-hydrogenase 1 b-type cytochrome subunit [Gammaproteobacteria bacterium BRH_c0]
MVKVKIWDLPIRIFHWLLPLLLGFSWYSAETRAMDWHRYSGYAVLGLLIFRLCWGLWGSHSARFASFIKGPASVLAYVRGPKPLAPAIVGHNPLGGWSVAALLLVLTVQVGSGLFAVDVDGLESGPLSRLVSFDAGRSLADIHEVSFNILLALVAVHLVAILWYEFARKERLVMAMLHGHKQLDSDSHSSLPPTPSSLPVRLLAALGLSAVMVYLISSGFRF